MHTTNRRVVHRVVTEITADDGRPLSGTWYRPAGPSAGHVVLAPAMATPAGFYHHFATWLAERGRTVLTFEYRGLSASTAELRRETATLLTWAADAAAALDHAITDATAVGSDTRVTWIGHSFGGQVLPFIRHDLIDQAVLVSSGNGFFHHNPPWLRRRATKLWRFVVPVSTAIFGYFPGKKLGIIGDLPRGVVRQWGRWCMHPGYWAADVPDIDERHATITIPVSLLWMRDDAILLRSGADAMARAMTAAAVEVIEVSPEAHDIEALGHHGIFRQQSSGMWEDVFGRFLPAREAAGTGA